MISASVSTTQKRTDVSSVKRLKRNEPSSTSTAPFSAKLPTKEAAILPEKKIRFAATSDPSRNKCIEMFFQSLQMAIEEQKAEDPDLHEPAEIEKASQLATQIEQALYEIHGAPTNDTYKKTFRSKYLNLKDKSNPNLRRQLFLGEVCPKDFIRMSAIEMASEERKREDDRIMNENLMKARAAQDNSPETDMIQCGRCKQRKCKYYQMQTRSADEPMTTFVTCINCSHRWRM